MLVIVVSGCAPDAPSPPDEPADGVGSHLTWQPLPEGAVTRVAFGSCTRHMRDQPIWDAVVEADPDLFMARSTCGETCCSGMSRYSTTEFEAAIVCSR